MLAFLLLILAAREGCCEENHVLVENGAAALIAAMKGISQTLECFSGSLQEGIRIHGEKDDALRKLYELPDSVMLLKEQMDQQNGKIDSVKQDFEALHKVEKLIQEIRDLKTELGGKHQMMDIHTQEITDLKGKLQDKDETVATLRQEVQDLKNQLGNKDAKIGDLQGKLEATTAENEINLLKVEDLDRKLGESQRHVQKLEEVIKQINNTVESQKKASLMPTDCVSQNQQEVEELVLAFNSDKSWATLRRGLESALDQDSAEYSQVQAIDYDSVEPLWEMGYRGYTQLATLLLCAGMPVDAVDNDDITLLYGAARGGHRQLVRLLLDRGADVNRRSSYGDTPLTMAAPRGHLEVVKMLVQAGADTSATDTSGFTALYWAKSRSQTEVAEYLEQFPN